VEKEPREHSDRHIDPNKRFRVVWRRTYSAWSPIAGLDDRAEKRKGRDGGSVVVASDSSK
jgi:hypothetical protein